MASADPLEEPGEVGGGVFPVEGAGTAPLGAFFGELQGHALVIVACHLVAFTR